MNAHLSEAIAPVLSVFYSLALAFLAVGIVATTAALTVGGKTPRRRRAAFSIVAALGFLLYGTFVLPRVLGIAP